MDPIAVAMADAVKAGDLAAAYALADWLLENRSSGSENSAASKARAAACLEAAEKWRPLREAVLSLREIPSGDRNGDFYRRWEVGSGAERAARYEVEKIMDTLDHAAQQTLWLVIDATGGTMPEGICRRRLESSVSELPEHPTGVLAHHGISGPAQLLKLGREGVRKLKGIGPVFLSQIVECMRRRGHEFV